jgi:hypothetical protein
MGDAIVTSGHTASNTRTSNDYVQDWLQRLRNKGPTPFVIPSEARNLSSI